MSSEYAPLVDDTEEPTQSPHEHENPAEEEDAPWMVQRTSPGSKKRGRGTESYKAELAKQSKVAEPQEQDQEQEQEHTESEPSTTAPESVKAPEVKQLIREVVPDGLFYDHDSEKINNLVNLIYYEDTVSKSNFQTTNCRVRLSEEKLKAAKDYAAKKDKEPYIPQPSFVLDNIQLIKECTQFESKSSKGTNYGMFFVCSNNCVNAMRVLYAIDHANSKLFNQGKHKWWPSADTPERVGFLDALQAPKFVYFKNKDDEKLVAQKWESKDPADVEEVNQILLKVNGKLHIEGNAYGEEPKTFKIKDFTGKTRYQIRKKKNIIVDPRDPKGKKKIEVFVRDEEKCESIPASDAWSWSETQDYLKPGAQLKLKFCLRGIGMDPSSKNPSPSNFHNVEIVEIKEFAKEVVIKKKDW